MTTKIEWCDETWNPITGCTPISEGCKNCYAANMAKRFWGDREFSTLQFHRDRLEQPPKWKKSRKIFLCSMGDIFHNRTKQGWLFHILDTIDECKQHTFIILTKRPQNIKSILYEGTPRYFNKDDFLPNIWLGVTVENQKTADERIPILLQIPAAVRFVSVEPMLEKITLNYLQTDMVEIDALNGTHGVYRPHQGKNKKIDWIICGAETGPGARRMKPEWAYDLYEQCKSAGVPFFFKKASKSDVIDLPREFPD